jgi:hypothetical protein
MHTANPLIIAVLSLASSWSLVGTCSSLSFPVLSCPFLSFPFLSCPFLSFPVLSCPFLSFPILSCPFLSCPVLSCPFLPFPVLSCPFLSFPIVSYPFLSSPLPQVSWPESCPVDLVLLDLALYPSSSPLALSCPVIFCPISPLMSYLSLA